MTGAATLPGVAVAGLASARTSSDVDIAVVRDAAAFAPYEAAWTDLMREHGPASPFRHPAWLRAMWSFHGARLSVVLEGDRERLRFGAVFFCADDAGTATLVPMRLLSLEPHLATIHPDSAIVAARPDFDPARLPALLTRGVRAARWSVAFINHLGPRTEWLARGLEDYARRERWWTRRDRFHPEARIEFPDGWDAYLRTRSKHWRDRITNARNRCARAGVTCADPAAEGLPWPEIEHRFRAVMAGAWQRETRSGAWSPRYRGILMHALERMHAAGALRMPMLLAGDRPIAVDVLLRVDDTQQCVLRAYHESMRHVSPGVALMEQDIRRGYAEGVRRILLGAYAYEHTAYKRHWMTSSTACDNLMIVRPWSWYAPLDLVYRHFPGIDRVWWKTRIGQRLRERWSRAWRRRAPR